MGTFDSLQRISDAIAANQQSKRDLILRNFWEQQDDERQEENQKHQRLIQDLQRGEDQWKKLWEEADDLTPGAKSFLEKTFRAAGEDAFHEGYTKGDSSKVSEVIKSIGESLYQFKGKSPAMQDKLADIDDLLKVYDADPALYDEIPPEALQALTLDAFGGILSKGEEAGVASLPEPKTPRDRLLAIKNAYLSEQNLADMPGGIDFTAIRGPADRRRAEIAAMAIKSDEQIIEGREYDLVKERHAQDQIDINGVKVARSDLEESMKIWDSELKNIKDTLYLNEKYATNPDYALTDEKKDELMKRYNMLNDRMQTVGKALANDVLNWDKKDQDTFETGNYYAKGKPIIYNVDKDGSLMNIVRGLPHKSQKKIFKRLVDEDIKKTKDVMGVILEEVKLGDKNSKEADKTEEQKAGEILNPPDNIGGRNNNPGNIKFARQPGAKKDTNSEFAIFHTVEDGANSIVRQLGLYKDRGLNLEQAIETYAPAKDNPNGYRADDVAQELGIQNTTTRLDDIDLVELARVIAKFETGMDIFKTRQ